MKTPTQFDLETMLVDANYALLHCRKDRGVIGNERAGNALERIVERLTHLLGEPDESPSVACGREAVKPQTVKINYDDDATAIVEKINDALESIGYELADDGLEHDGWIILTLAEIECDEETP